jgi:peptidoglycan lytic transglycosylase G
VERDDRLRPPRPSRRQVRTRRALAIGALLAVIGGGAAFAATHIHRHHPLPPAPSPPHEYKILFPEGFTRSEMAARVGAVAKIAQGEGHDKKVKLNERAYLAASAHLRVPCFTPSLQKKPEGFLFPSTYDFIAKEPSKGLVQSQLTAFCQNWKKVDLSYARSKNLTPYDVLTIASMIQGEVQVPSENKLVSAVIYNRLHAGMTLGIDATLRYGLNIPPTKSLTPTDLANPTPYNTRLHTGLPPTPIGNPGLAAIEAAAHPANVNYLYFVRKPDHKHHYFTSSYQDFVNHEIQYGYSP